MRKACRIRACNEVLAHTHAHTHSREISTFISEGKIFRFLDVSLPCCLGNRAGGSASAWDERKPWQFIRARAPGEQLAFRDQSLPGTERAGASCSKAEYILLSQLGS